MINKEDKIKEIKEKLTLYPAREIKIEDMKLQLEELKLCDSLNAQGYEETVQASMKCKNNDKMLFEREKIINTINFYETSNKRVDNWLKLIKTQKARETIECIFIYKMSKTQTAKKIERCRRHIDNLLDTGVEEIYEELNTSQ